MSEHLYHCYNSYCINQQTSINCREASLYFCAVMYDHELEPCVVFTLLGSQITLDTLPVS